MSADTMLYKESFRDDVVIIGPPKVGKTTVSLVLANKLQQPCCHLDTLRWEHYSSFGYSREKESAIQEAEGFLGVYRYWKPFEAQLVIQILQSQHGCVFDFGAGHSVYDTRELFTAVSNALRPFRHVILLLPFRSLKLSYDTLWQRLSIDERRSDSLLKHFIWNECNMRLATQIIYTETRSPEQVCDEIVGVIS